MCLQTMSTRRQVKRKAEYRANDLSIASRSMACRLNLPLFGAKGQHHSYRVAEHIQAIGMAGIVTRPGG